LKDSNGTQTGNLRRIIREQCWKQEIGAAAHVGIEQIPVILNFKKISVFLKFYI
jgi:hypothetical protein